MAAHQGLDPLIQYLQNRTGRKVTQKELCELMGIKPATYRVRLREGFTANELIDAALGLSDEGITPAELLEEFGIVSREEYLGELPGKTVAATRKAASRERTKVRSGYRRPQ